MLDPLIWNFWLRPCITAQRKGMLRDHLTHITSNHRTKCSKPSRNLTRVPSFSLHKTKTKCPGPIKSNTFSWKRFVWLGFLPRASTATRPVITHYLSHTLTTAHVTAEDRRRRPEWFQGKRIGIRKERGPVAKATGMGVRVPAVWWYRPTEPPTLYEPFFLLCKILH